MKLIYRLCIFKIVLLYKDKNPWIKDLPVFAKFVIETDSGYIQVLFKRSRRHDMDNKSFVHKYIVEFDPVNELEYKNTLLKDSVIMVIKVVLVKVHPDILAEVLYDVFVKTYIKYGKMSK